MLKHVTTLSALVLLCTGPLSAGVYDGSTLIRVSMIVHPFGYDGSGGTLPVAVCVRPGDEILKPFLQDALTFWNDLAPTTGNCSGCITTEEFAGMPGMPPELVNLRRTLLHELGHCGLGLGHTNWDVTSFSNADDATSGQPCGTTPCPPDAIPGDFDDILFPRPPDNPAARIVHWFKEDPDNPANANNPFAIDSTVIDQDTFTRARFRLPVGHTWVTNANRRAGDRFGFPNTHSLMYTPIFGGEQVFGLTADEVSTVQFSRTGRDKIAGTADDYVAVFSFVDDCAMADIEVQWRPGSTDPDLGPDGTGFCDAGLEPIPGEPSPPQHYRVTNSGLDPPIIKINSEMMWRELTPSVFLDGFEAGDTSGWSSTSP